MEIPFYWPWELDNLPDPQWQVDNLFQVETLVAVAATEGTGKTFFCLDLACCVATSKPFFNRQVVPGKVAYIYVEGTRGAKQRLHAWHAEYPEVLTAPVGIVPVAIPFTERDGDGIESLAEKIHQMSGDDTSLIVVDTLSRNFGPGDEDSTRDMNLFTTRCDWLRNQLKATVLVVHHTGWHEARERGNRSLRNNFDTIIKMRKSKGNDRLVQIECVKQKDAPHFQPFNLLLHDAHGACVFREAKDEAMLPPLTPSQEEQLRMLRAGARIYKDWLAEVERLGLCGRTTFKRNLSHLTFHKLVHHDPETGLYRLSKAARNLISG